MSAPEILRLGEREVPSGSLIAFLSDLHIPEVDAPAVRLAIECCEREGVTHVVLGGDIYDCGPASRHEGKRRRDAIEWGTLEESAAPGRWVIDWARTRPCYYLRGNHERWVEDRIAEDGTLAGRVTPEALLGIPEDGAGWRVLPSGSRIRLGSLNIEHLDGLFPRGTGGTHPAGAILRRAPDQSTLGGHVHRISSCWTTTQDEEGINRTRVAVTSGHLSVESSHHAYMGAYPGWQVGFTLVRVWWEARRPRYTITPVEIHRDRRGRPIFEHGGHVYR